MEDGGKGEDKRTGPYHQLANLSSLQTLRFPLSLLCFSWKLPLIFPRNSPRLPNSSYINPLSVSLLPKYYRSNRNSVQEWGGHNCMTSASELFSRRSRLGRAAPAADFVGLELPDDRNFHYISNRRHHHHRHDLDGCDPLRRAQHFRHISHRVYRPDREPVRLDQGTRQPSSSSSNSVSTSILSGISHRQRFTGSDRLPGAVLLARERLLARLSGVPPSGNRRSSRPSLDIHLDDYTFGDDFRLTDFGDWGSGWLTGGTPSSHLNSETLLPPLMREPSKKKPPGLTQEALDSLHQAVFSRAEGAGEGMSRASRDCSICLDGYREGDKLTCLPCGHKFHSACLDPWVRTCGDCPYCRSVIVISS